MVFLSHPIFFLFAIQFSGENSEKMKSAYGEFCSSHMESVELYKVKHLTELFVVFINTHRRHSIQDMCDRLT